MSKLNYQYDLQNLTPANAAPVEANFTRTENHINQEVIERDGSVGMRAQLKLVGDPIAALDAAPKQYVDQVLPVGLIMMWAAAAIPANGRWLFCDGAAIETALYPELFAVIGYTWGGAGGSFNTPNMGGRAPIGPNGAHAVASKGGSEDSSLPAHTHSIDHTHGAAYTAQTDTNHLHGGANHAHAINTWTGGGGTHSHGVPLGGSRGFVVDGPSGTSAGIQTADGTSYGIEPFSSSNGDHSHAINSGTDLADRDLTTGWMDRNNPHNHWFQPPGHTGPTGQAGVAPTGTNMQPFVTVPFIIRCR